MTKFVDNGCSYDLVSWTGSRMCQVDPKHLPFARNDRYGDMGIKPQPLAEKCRLAVLSVTTLPLKVIGAASCIIGFYLVCRLSEVLPASIKMPVTALLGKFFSRLCLLSIGFASIKRVKVGHAAWDRSKGDGPAAGIVSNHCSHTDILIHMARSFPSFVARGGTESIPLIGFIS